MATRPKVVIVGGGFGGLEAAKALRDAPVEVTLVDRRNHHVFQPLLYQVATAGLSPADIAEPLRRILRDQENVTVLLGEAERVDLAGKRLVLTDGEVPYDHLILACGASHSWFGHDEWAEHALGLKTLEDAREVRRRVLLAYERAERTEDAAERAALLTFVVIGGGPTGVEMAGAFAEIAHLTLARDFRRIDPHQARVHLIEAGPRLLPAFAEDLSAATKASLEKLKVTVHLNARVTAIAHDEVRFGDQTIAAKTILWAAGVQGAPIARTLGVELDRAGRVKVRPDFSLEGHPEVFVIGDMAALTDAKGVVVPGVCQGAMQAGKLVGKNLVRGLDGTAPEPFVYRDLGIMATIGRAHAVVQLPRFRFSGFFAWLFWAFLHVALLIGFDNRLVVMIEWMWAWFTFDRGARLITHERPHG
ncbi:MAG: NAD(P)/FAD-dependent oxidoreductase [Myxococcales bacterium]|nr:NAD(P)/FAD-dependent oxidoreductase [Myxococcales bacterium]